MRYKKTDIALLFIVIGFFGCDPDSDTAIVGATDDETNSSLYDYSLNDVNPSSSTYGGEISPSYYNNKVTVHYFGHQN